MFLIHLILEALKTKADRLIERRKVFPGVICHSYYKIWRGDRFIFREHICEIDGTYFTDTEEAMEQLVIYCMITTMQRLYDEGISIQMIQQISKDELMDYLEEETRDADREEH